MSEEITTTTYVAYQIHHNFPDVEAPVPTDVRHPRRDVKHAAESVYAFYYFDIVRTVVDVGGERIEVASERRNVSKRYYIDARMLEYEEICNLPGDYRIALTWTATTARRMWSCCAALGTSCRTSR